jgi:hypothetical protein
MPLNEHQDAEHHDREVGERRAARDAAATENKIRDGYARLGHEPVYAGHGVLPRRSRRAAAFERGPWRR